MTAAVTPDAIGKRFRLDPPPMLTVPTATGTPVTFARLRSAQSGHGRTMAVPGEDAFAFQVMLQPLLSAEVWMGGKHIKVPAARPGDTFLFDLGRNPITGLNSPFDTLRFYISRPSLDEMAYERGMRAIGGLRAPSFGANDAVMHGLAVALAATLEGPVRAPTMFAEYIALAFHAHIVSAYGYGPLTSERHGGLAPWQLRRARDIMTENLDGDPSIAQLARECQLSHSYFARAFKQTTGMAPHQWLMQRRVERAKELLRGGQLELADIASACGFADQSHLSRVFSRMEGHSPGRWRRAHSGSDRGPNEPLPRRRSIAAR